MSHTCHALGCDIAVPPKYLMCARHWRMVPHRLQLAVWAQYKPGQEIRKDPSTRYLVAMADAVNAVAEKEGRAERMPYPATATESKPRAIECNRCDGIGQRYNNAMETDGVCTKCNGKGWVGGQTHED